MKDVGRAFEVRGEVAGAKVPVIVHVPHSGTHIPAEVRSQFVLDDETLRQEIVQLTDWHVDELFDGILEIGGVIFVNRLSRLVVDPERFVDEAREEMASKGMGAVYTRTAEGMPLRRDGFSSAERERLLSEYFVPYAKAFKRLTAETLARFDHCLIIDAHSFPSAPLPYELDQSPNRPDICIGTDSFHTPENLACSIEQKCGEFGMSVARNRPFSGTYVPMRFFGKDGRVASVMIEVRRGLYCDETTGEKLAAFGKVREIVGALMAAVTAAYGR